MSSERSPAVGRLLSEAAWPRNYRAIAFQERRRLARCGALQVHLTLYPLGSFRTGNIDGDDCHFAFRTDDFDGALATLIANGFHEHAAEDDPMRVMVGGRNNGGCWRQRGLGTSRAFQ